MQYLYKASELIAAGMTAGQIVSIKFNVTALNAFTGTIPQYTIKIGQVTTSSLSATTWETTTATVFGPVDYVPILGINTLSFTNPFLWDGSSNIVIEICNGDPNNSSTVDYTENVTVPWTTGLTFNGSHNYRADNLGNLCGSAAVTNTGLQTNRPNIIFSLVGNVACSGSPNTGIATTSTTNACYGQSFTLNATGITIASDIQYQWQVSANDTSYSNIAGATTISFVTSQSSTSYYRLKTTCINSSIAVYSKSVLVNTASLAGGVYTINKNAAASSSNFQSFNAAYNAIKCGIQGPVIFNVVVGSGPYSEQLIINGKIPNSSSINTITFNGNGETIGYASTTTSERAIIKLKGAKYFVFESLNVNTSPNIYGFGFHLLNDADSNIIRKCTIAGSTTTGSTRHAGIVISAIDTSAVGLGYALCDANLIETILLWEGIMALHKLLISSVGQMGPILSETIPSMIFTGMAFM